MMRHFYRVIIVNTKCKIEYKIDNEVEEEGFETLEITGQKYLKIGEGPSLKFSY